MPDESFPGIRQVELTTDGRIEEAEPLQPGEHYPGHFRFSVTALRFDDRGSLRDPDRLASASQWITHLREGNPNGVITVVFVHGWRHDGEWDGVGVESGDDHYAAFRNKILRFLALREAERDGDSRYLFGIYVGWDGHREVRAHRLPGSFFDRYRTAVEIAAAGDLRASLIDIFRAAKQTTNRSQPASPLILIGHSMGGLMLETVLLELIREEHESLFAFAGDPLHTPAPARMRDARGALAAISFPDVVLTVNSAGPARGMEHLRRALDEKGVVKRVAEDSPWRYRYSPPILVSFQSEADFPNRCLWPVAKMRERRKARRSTAVPSEEADREYGIERTVGFDPSIATHELRLVERSVDCAPIEAEDFGQNHHCLRAPTGLALEERATPPFFVDLPDEERRSKEHHPEHSRWELRPIVDPSEPRLAWIFRVPKELMSGHGDIFSSRASSLSLALTQISGAVVSLARTWDDSFEGEGGPPLEPLPERPDERSE